MKTISSDIGRCLRLFSWDEVRPTHGINASMIVNSFADRFNFQFKPDSPVAPNIILKFAEGTTLINDELVAIQKTDIYSDGFGVDCSNTDDANRVSEEMLDWARSALGYRDFIRQPKVILISQVTVEFDSTFENIFKGWKKIQSLLNGSVHARYGFDKNIDVHRLQWRSDASTVVNSSLVSDFYIERKAQEPHSSNRWHCSGPLPTNDWLQLLEQIEAIAMSN